MPSNELSYKNPAEIFSLEGKVCLLTGAAGFLGRQMAASLCAAGAFVYLNGRTIEPLEILKMDIQSRGGECDILPFDITIKAEIDKAIDLINTQNGHLDILINNAYTGKAGKFCDTCENDFISAYQTGLAASASLITSCLPLLRANATSQMMSSIINIASMYGIVSPDPGIYGDTGHDNPPSYGAMKAALIQYTRYAATNLATEHIRVNSISPGAFPSAKVKNDMPELWDKLNHKPPLKRVGQPDELQGALIYLASNASSYVTGSNLVIDGGWTVW